MPGPGTEGALDTYSGGRGGRCGAGSPVARLRVAGARRGRRTAAPTEPLGDGQGSGDPRATRSLPAPANPGSVSARRPAPRIPTQQRARHGYGAPEREEALDPGRGGRAWRRRWAAGRVQLGRGGFEAGKGASRSGCGRPESPSRSGPLSRGGLAGSDPANTMRMIPQENPQGCKGKKLRRGARRAPNSRLRTEECWSLLLFLINVKLESLIGTLDRKSLCKLAIRMWPVRATKRIFSFDFFGGLVGDGCHPLRCSGLTPSSAFKPEKENEVAF